jgi:hypothetical protein
LANFPRGFRPLTLVLSLLAWAHPSAAQGQASNSPPIPAQESLPSAPEPQKPVDVASAAAGQAAALSATPAASSLPEARKYYPVVEPGQSAPRLSALDKLLYSARENVRIVTLFPALYSAGYEQLRGTDPKYGSDAGAGAVKFGASMLRSATTRTLSDGIFAGAFHQDPRYHRVATGGIVSRGLRSAEQAFVRQSDDGADQINASGLVGRAAAAALTLGYYPKPSRNARVVLSTFSYSIATDAGGNLVLEFFPDLMRKFPALKRFQLR